MDNFKKYIKSAMPCIISIVFALCIFFLADKTQILTGFELDSLDFRFFMRDPGQLSEEKKSGVIDQNRNLQASEDIMILGIDEETIRFFGESGIQWPFPWEIHSTFVDFVSSGNPDSILMDIMFLDHKPAEETLAESIASSGRVFLDYPFEKQSFTRQFADIEKRREILERHSLSAPREDSLPQLYKEVVPPTPLIAKAAAGLGHANVEKDYDDVTRTSPLIIRFEDRYYPSIVLSIVMNYYGITKEDLVIEPGKCIQLTNIPPAKQKFTDGADTVTIPINEHGHMNINYVGTHNTFDSLPYFYFYNEGSMEGNDSIKGKIVLVAAYASTGVSDDLENSPFGEMYGIEHHAHAINTIINGIFLREMSSVQLFILLIALALLFGLVISRMSILLSTGMAMLLFLGYIVLCHYLFEKHHFVMSYSTPSIYIVINYILITTYRIFSEQREKLYIRKTFSKFVSKGVVDELLRHPEMIKLGGEKKFMTVLFSDIRGFTSLSEKLTPEQLVEHLNVYLQAMTDIVIKYHGTLDKYVGDEIMAFWGAPVPQEDHALRACKAALDMMTSLQKLNESWSVDKQLDIGIGLNSGDMIVGNMGSAARMDYTLMGDNVNLGARLEGTNKVYHTQIIISEYTYEIVKEYVYTRELDLIRVKGKEKPVKIYELMGMKDD